MAEVPIDDFVGCISLAIDLCEAGLMQSKIIKADTTMKTMKIKTSGLYFFMVFMRFMVYSYTPCDVLGFSPERQGFCFLYHILFI